MKTTLGVLLAIAVLAGAWSAYRIGSQRSKDSRSGPPPASAVTRGDEAPASHVVHSARLPPLQARSTASSSAGAESHPVPKLPLSTAEVPLTPKLDEAYQELYKTYGPGVTTWIDVKLARRAELAKCGISEPGAAKFVLRSRVDQKAGTQTVEELVSIVTSYQGEMNDIVIACVRDAVIGKVEKHVSAVPAWFNAEQRRDWQDSPLDHEIDTVSFPIQDDELYRLFSEGRVSAYQETETKAQYGWK
jgi:hypothetical protein